MTPCSVPDCEYEAWTGGGKGKCAPHSIGLIPTTMEKHKGGYGHLDPKTGKRFLIELESGSPVYTLVEENSQRKKVQK